MSENSTIDLNSVGCIKEVGQFGHYELHNICTGVVAKVDWGFTDWVGAGALTFVAALLVAVLGGIIIGIASGRL